MTDNNYVLKEFKYDPDPDMSYFRFDTEDNIKESISEGKYIVDINRDDTVYGIEFYAHSKWEDWLDIVKLGYVSIDSARAAFYADPVNHS